MGSEGPVRLRVGLGASSQESCGFSQPYRYFLQGPAFLPSGIYKPAFLVTLTDEVAKKPQAPATHPLLVSSSGPLFIEEHSLEIAKKGQTPIALPDEKADWIVNVTLWIRSSVAIKSPSISLAIPELGVVTRPVTVKSLPGSTHSSTPVTASFAIPDSVPQRWFPHNLGTPKLYNITTTIHTSSSSSFSFVTRTGFRTITLVQAPYSQADIDTRGITPGDQWHFEINGKAFYSSGTNIIPYDPFYARTTSEKVRWVLESAVLSGQNMVRSPSFGQK